jgi:hypothetical protein
MKKYHLHNGSEQEGPFTIEELSEKNINRETEIWFEGLDDWKKAGEVEELNELFKIIPPPIKSKVQATPPPIQKEKLQDRNEPAKKTSSWSAIILKSVFTTALIVLGIMGFNKIFNNTDSNSGNSVVQPLVDEVKKIIPKEETYEEKVERILKMEQSQPTKFLNATGTYRENLLGDKIKISCTIENNATSASYKDAVVRVTFFSKTKTILGSEDFTVYEVFNPQNSKTVELKVNNYTDVSTLGWDVIKAKV